MTSLQGSWTWRKSSFSEGNGNSDCVEVGYWRKSTFSESHGNSDCVEVGWADDSAAVRDSKNPDGQMLVVSRFGWAAFRAKVTD